MKRLHIHYFILLTGEYVTLYQMQRAALQQRAREKDHQLANLSAEREELRRKLQELNQLVHRLLEERGPEIGKEALSSLEALHESTAIQNDSGKDVFFFLSVAFGILNMNLVGKFFILGLSLLPLFDF